MCCAQAASGQIVPQKQNAAETPSSKSLPFFSLARLQFDNSLPPAPKVPLRQVAASIKLPPLAGPAENVCAGRLDGMYASTGPLKMSSAAGLKGKTTGNPKYDALIVASAVRNKIDPALLYSMMMQESSFNANAVSPKGAGGLMQLMPETAARFGVRNVFNPAQNIEAGARYLRFLLDTFNGDVSLALAGYNAGEGSVRKYGRNVPPYPETKKYVSKIKRRYEGICSGK
jgi:soluble lytic murein transglycosylase-like protein